MISRSAATFRGRPGGRPDGDGSVIAIVGILWYTTALYRNPIGRFTLMPHTQDRKGLALLLLCAVQFMVVLDIAIVNVALPTIKTALSFDETSLSWVINAYTLTFGGLLMLGGRTADLLGRRRMFIAGLALFSGASLACGLATSETTLIAARAIQGVGAAIISPAALSILT